MRKRFRLIAPIVTLAVVAGILLAQKAPRSELAGTLEKFQRQLQDLQNQARNLQESLRQIARQANQNIPPGPPAAVTATPSPSVSASFPARNQALNDGAVVQKALVAYQQGLQFEDQKVFHAALDAFSEAIRLDPRNDSAYLHRGYGYSQLGDHTNAASDFTKSLALQPNNSRAYFARATEYAALGQDPLALSDVNEAMVRDPRNPEALVLRGRLYQLEGDPQKASTDYTVALSFDPDSETAYLGRAASRRNQDLQPLALSDCDSAVRVNPNSPAGYLCRAESYNRTGAPERAIEQLNQAVLTVQTLRQPFTLLADILQNMSGHRLAQASSAPSQTSPSPASPPQTPARAMAEMRAPEPQTTISTPAPVLPAPPPSVSMNRQIEDAGYYDRLGRIRLAESKFSEAVKAFDQAVRFDPRSATAFNGRGYAQLRLANYWPAVGDFSDAIRLNPGYLNAYQNRAVALRMAGEKQAAVDDERKMLDILRGTRTASLPAH